MGAITITNVKQGGPGSRTRGKRMVEADVAFSSSYATGGDTINIETQLGLVRVDEILIPSHDFNTRKAIAHPASGLSIALGGTATAPKLLAYDAQATEITAATNLASRGPIRVRFSGV